MKKEYPQDPYFKKEMAVQMFACCIVHGNIGYST